VRLVLLWPIDLRFDRLDGSRFALSQLLFQAAQVLAAYLSKGMFSNFQRGLLAIGLSRKRYAL
jgi:hypothetical protein